MHPHEPTDHTPPQLPPTTTVTQATSTVANALGAAILADVATKNVQLPGVMQQPSATVSRRQATATPTATTDQWWQAGVYMYAAIGVAAAGLVVLAAMAVYRRRQARTTKFDSVQPVKSFTRVASGDTQSATASGHVVKQAW